MNKIPTLFVRDPETNLKHVKNEVQPECKWVLDGEGVPTRKFDGTCVMWDGTTWWARREVKPGKAAPPNFHPSGGRRVMAAGARPRMAREPNVG